MVEFYAEEGENYEVVRQPNWATHAENYENQVENYFLGKITRKLAENYK